MMKQMMTWNGSATRKEWWTISACTVLPAALCLLLAPFGWGSAAAALLMLPWLAVSARRMHSTGNEPAPCLFSFAGVAALLAVLPLLSEATREIALPFAQLLLLVGGIVALSYAVICGFVSGAEQH